MLLGIDIIPITCITSTLLLMCFLEIVLIYAQITMLHNKWKDLKGSQNSFLAPLVNFIKFKNYKIGAGAVLKNMYSSEPILEYVGFYIGLQPALLVRNPTIMNELFNQNFFDFTNCFNKNDFPNTYNSIIFRNMCDFFRNNWFSMRLKLASDVSPSSLLLWCPQVLRSTNEFNSKFDEYFQGNKLWQPTGDIEKHVRNVIQTLPFGNLSKEDQKLDYENMLAWQNEMLRISNDVISRLLLPETIRDCIRLSVPNLNIEQYLNDMVKQVVFYLENTYNLNNNVTEKFTLSAGMFYL